MDLKTREGRRAQGELIKAASAAAGFTLKELATRLGVSHALIYQYVSGANLAQPDKLQEIALLTGLPVSYFFGETALPSGAGAPPAAPAAGELESTGPSAPTGAVPAERTRAAPEPQEPPVGIDTGRAPVDSARLQQTIRSLEALAQAQDLPGRDLAGLISTLEQMLGLARLSGDPLREAELLFRIGNARTDSGDLKGAGEALEECAALFRDLGVGARALGAIQSLARCRSLTGQLEEAEALFRQVAASSNPDLAWRGLLGVGQLMEQRDRYEEALAEYDLARQAIDSLPAAAPGRRLAELYVRTNVANVYMAEGDFATAVPLWQENLDRTEELSLPDQFLEALLSEALCTLHLGRPGQAWERIRRGVRLCRLLGDKERLALGLACFAETLAVAGQFDQGKEYAREGARIAADSGAARGVSFSNLALARSLLLAGQAENARFYLDPETLSPSPKMRAAALILRSDLWLRQGEGRQAQEDARSALAQIRDAGALHLEKAAWVALGRAALLSSDLPVVEEAITAALPLGRFTPGYPETAWQLAALEGGRARLSGDFDAALRFFEEAMGVIQSFRADFATFGVVEACLDDPDRLQVYRDAIGAARDAGRPERADQILVEAAWPPLQEGAP